MKCPYCNGEMQSGTLFGSPKGGAPTFRTDEWLSKNRMDRLFDSLGSSGILIMPKYSIWYSYRTPALFCPKCKKMIIDTDVSK